MIILAVVAILGVKTVDFIVKQFANPIMWLRVIDGVYENRIIAMLDDLEYNLDDIMAESRRKLIAEEYRTKTPIEIPEFAIRKPRSKSNGYEQIEYNWRDEIYM